MLNCSEDFSEFDGRIWLNCAHQGALPLVAARAAEEAIAWKLAPYQLTTERFTETPLRLKAALGKLINAPAEEIILGNSASYGMHLLANGLPLGAGDEVIVMDGDFPTNILPWLGLRDRGIAVRPVIPANQMIGPEELSEKLTKSSRVVCLSWVHSFSGFASDIEAIGRLCKSAGVRFIVNCSQALGTRPLDVSTAPIDALVSVGFKWLCGPYGTGFCWMRPELRESLVYNQAYWLSLQTADDLMQSKGQLEPRSDIGARKYDVFGTANFFNFKPWTASVEYLLSKGIESIRSHNENLVSRFIAGLNRDLYELLSPADGPRRSTLILITHRDKQRNADIHQSLKQRGIDIAFRDGKLRFAPHLFNTEPQIDRALAALQEIGK